MKNISKLMYIIFILTILSCKKDVLDACGNSMNGSNKNSADQVVKCNSEIRVGNDLAKDTLNRYLAQNTICTCYYYKLLNNDSLKFEKISGKPLNCTGYYFLKRNEKKYEFKLDSTSASFKFNNSIYNRLDTLGYTFMNGNCSEEYHSFIVYKK
ncbi:MAG: hypothetical protein EAZ53_11220 [Bacteroidetes bacterium]|nr:MAG: hypothetical protein EAZ53_11220 [Bacteroidota bacterium]